MKGMQAEWWVVPHTVIVEPLEGFEERNETL